ncbi:MAG: hypothetical protein V3T70_01800, partial [Phycisphaerae bacterium]
GIVCAWPTADARADDAAGRQANAAADTDAELSAHFDQLLRRRTEPSVVEPPRDPILLKLEQQWNADPRHFVERICGYARSHANVKSGMLFGVLVRDLRIPDQAVILATLPLLESADEEIRTDAIGILAQYERASARQAPDFSFYQSFVTSHLRRNQAAPSGLVRHMYETAPGVAVLTMMYAHSDRDPDSLKSILSAEHVVADVLWKQQHGFLGSDEVEPRAMLELDHMSRDDRWWARLYVAAILRRHPEFNTNALAQRLEADTNELVRRFVTEEQDAPR